MVKVTCLLAKAGSGVGLSFGVRALTEMEIRCVKGMFRLKVISSEKNSVFKGLNILLACIDFSLSCVYLTTLTSILSLCSMYFSRVMKDTPGHLKILNIIHFFRENFQENTK